MNPKHDNVIAEKDTIERYERKVSRLFVPWVDLMKWVSKILDIGHVKATHDSFSMSSLISLTRDASILIDCL